MLLIIKRISFHVLLNMQHPSFIYYYNWLLYDGSLYDCNKISIGLEWLWDACVLLAKVSCYYILYNPKHKKKNDLLYKAPRGTVG